MALTVQQYKEILSIALDHQLAELRGGLVFDDFDPVVEADKLLRARVEKLVNQKKVDKLEKMLQEFKQRFRLKDEYNFAEILLQKTGLNIEPLSSQQSLVPARRNLPIYFSGKEDYSLTSVALELETGSGSIYCIKGVHTNLKANWLDEHTIEVQIPPERDEVEKVSKVRIYDETINVIYKDL